MRSRLLLLWQLLVVFTAQAATQQHEPDPALVAYCIGVLEVSTDDLLKSGASQNEHGKAMDRLRNLYIYLGQIKEYNIDSLEVQLLIESGKKDRQYCSADPTKNTTVCGRTKRCDQVELTDEQLLQLAP